MDLPFGWTISATIVRLPENGMEKLKILNAWLGPSDTRLHEPTGSVSGIK